MPVLEIKDPNRTTKGSIGAFKPDLVAAKSGHLLLGECKPQFDLDDVEKLRLVLNSSTRLRELSTELSLRGLPGANSLVSGFVAIGSEINGPLLDIGLIVCTSIESARLIPATGWMDDLTSSFA